MVCGLCLRAVSTYVTYRTVTGGAPLRATWRHSLLACAVAWLALGPAARADVFDDARRTLRKGVPHFFRTDVPHFFEDDLPCAFGGKPTSHVRAACSRRAAKHVAGKKPHARHEAARATAPVVPAAVAVLPAPEPLSGFDHVVTTHAPPALGPQAARVENREVALRVCGGDGYVLIGESSGRDAHGSWFRLDYGCLAKDEAPAAPPDEQASER